MVNGRDAESDEFADPADIQASIHRVEELLRRVGPAQPTLVGTNPTGSLERLGSGSRAEALRVILRAHERAERIRADAARAASDSAIEAQRLLTQAALVSDQLKQETRQELLQEAGVLHGVALQLSAASESYRPAITTPDLVREAGQSSS